MVFDNIKATLGKQLSIYSGRQTAVMRKGKYTAGMHYNDGYAAMLFESIMETEESDNFHPLGKEGIRSLIFAFNRLTKSSVPDVWEDSV
jgi:hypothetical protein